MDSGKLSVPTTNPTLGVPGNGGVGGGLMLPTPDCTKSSIKMMEKCPDAIQKERMQH
eukprot:CAMPEP_0114991398 /NCGR_PEP_ID=MMETSP0216-20121206/11347_1 /TAXON_ID=223996 /ORGANISM="Protocruzia adherens, Strain Boccale" /LENGTH=56 /DNA_ID=CAMNT_0002354715 /DNA_START=206 /DNA_END=376 /DNA_ORIENTATION=+